MCLAENVMLPSRQDKVGRLECRKDVTRGGHGVCLLRGPDLLEHRPGGRGVIG
jgi:hypothetical protein